MIKHLIVDSFPLSPMQQGMLFHHLMEPHSGVDIQQLVVHLPEEVDASRLEAAWQVLVRRHDILRARFVWEGIEQPEQEIAADVSVPFVVEAARHLSEQDQRERPVHAQVGLATCTAGPAPGQSGPERPLVSGTPEYSSAGTSPWGPLSTG